MDRVTLECHGVATVIFMASPGTPTAHPSRQTDQARARYQDEAERMAALDPSVVEDLRSE